MVERDHIPSADGALLAILNSSPLAIVAVSAEGTVTMWNPAAERMFGWAAAETLGGPLPCIPPEDMDNFAAVFATVLSGQAVEALEVQRLHKDGRHIDVSLSLAPIPDDHGRIAGAVGVMDDISHRKAEERARQDGDRLLRLALTRGRLLAGRLDLETGVVSWIGGDSEILFGDRAPSTFAAFLDLVHPEDRSAIGGTLAERPTGSTEVEFRVINADGSGLINLTNDTIHPGERIAWSPDGHRVAFDCDRDICVINADGSGPVAEPYSRARTGLPVGGFTWSPDGQRIVFATGTDIGIRNTYVYVMNADGSGLIALGEWPVNDCCPAWSPDGQRVAFVSERDGTPGIRTDGMIGIYVANADGSQVTQLTEVAAVDVYHQRLYEYRPVWSPDGRQITFASDTDGDWDIYVIDADGAGLINLTNSRADDYSPVWSPAP